MSREARRVGIVGFGRIGQYLHEEVRKVTDYEVAFVWNRTLDKMEGIVEENLILHNLDDFASRSPDLIVEVSHPLIVAKYGVKFLQEADFLVGSPTALSDDVINSDLTREATHGSHGLYVASGALWGAQDIQKMADRGTLQGLKVTMKKHPSAFKVCGYLLDVLKSVQDRPVTLYEGPVRGLCPLAPHNVNTMACAAIAGHNLGFDRVTGCLVADPKLSSHVVEVEVKGPGEPGNMFSVNTIRNNPAAVGVVTGTLTYASFLSSLINAKNRGRGVHIC